MWTLMQSTLNEHGLKTDVVFDDAEHPLLSSYTNVYYWNENSVLLFVPG
jgi:hypothetical protein